MSDKLPMNWEWIPLGEYVENHDAARDPVSSKEREKRQGKYPYYGASGVIDQIDGYTHQGEYLLLGEDGANLLARSKPIAFLAKGKFWVNNHAHVLKCKGEAPNAYLAYYLNRIDLAHYVTGTAQPKLSQSKMNNIPIPVAPLDQQKQIVAEIEKQFSRLDEAVANLKRVKANLKRYKASILKAAVEGKLTEDWRKQHPNVEPASKLLERILTERRAKWNGRGKYKEPAEMDASIRTSLPDGWLWASIESLSTKVVDGVHKKPNYVSSGVPFVTVRNLTAGPGINLVKLNFVTREDHEQFIKRADPEEGDVLISKDGTLGVVRVIRTKAIFSIFVSVALVKPALKEMSDYLGVALSSPQVQVQMVPKGSGLQHIHLEDLRADCVPIPPLDEQKEIVAEVERRLSVIEELEAAAQTNLTRADRLRQSILHQAFSGQLACLQRAMVPPSLLKESRGRGLVSN